MAKATVFWKNRQTCYCNGLPSNNETNCQGRQFPAWRAYRVRALVHMHLMHVNNARANPFGMLQTDRQACLRRQTERQTQSPPVLVSGLSRFTDRRLQIIATWPCSHVSMQCMQMHNANVNCEAQWSPACLQNVSPYVCGDTYICTIAAAAACQF